MLAVSFSYFVCSFIVVKADKNLFKLLQCGTGHINFHQFRFIFLLVLVKMFQFEEYRIVLSPFYVSHSRIPLQLTPDKAKVDAGLRFGK